MVGPLQEPLTTVVIKAEPLVPEPMDFPWINQNSRGRNYQFLYSLGKELLHPNKVKILTQNPDPQQTRTSKWQNTI